MGLLKKIKRGFKKVTKGVSKVLDKVVPNEIKSYLPYAAALAPYMLPANFAGGSGLAALFRRGLLTGGLNLGSQLAQEGSEGDYNPLSVLLAAGQGAMTAEGAGDYFRSGINKGKAVELPGGNMPGQGGVMDKFGNMQRGFTYDTSGISGLDKAKNFALRSGAKLADLGASANKTLSDPFATGNTFTSLSKAAAPAVSFGTGDLAYADANRLNKQFAKDEAIQMATDAAAAAGASAEDIAAVTASMTNYGYDQSEIDNIISQFFSNGGRVGYNDGGGIMGMMSGGGMDASQPDFDEEYITIMTETGPKRIKKSDYESMSGMFMDTTTSLYGDAGRGRPVPEFANGGRTGFRMGGGKFEAPDFMSISEAAENVDGDVIEDSFEGATAGGYKLNDFEINDMALQMTGQKLYNLIDDPEAGNFDESEVREMLYEGQYASGGIINAYNMGGSVLPQGMEMDYRQGGMIPMGSAERADDVPARVSKNEFVMTADAVRAAGGGSVNKGAKRMYEMMNNLEARA